MCWCGAWSRGSPRTTCKGRVVCEDRLQSAQRADSEGRSRHSARCVDHDCAGRKGCDRRLQHCGQQDLREAAERCEDGDDGLYAGRQSGGHGGVRRHRVGIDRLWPHHRPLRLLQLRVVHCAAHDLPAGYDDRQARCLCPAQGSVRHQPIRAEAGVLHVEGRHARAHVHCRQERA